MSGTKWFIVIAVLLAVVCVQASVVTEEFSTVNGYVDGNLNGQKNWVEETAGTFVVNSGGSGSLSVANTALKHAYFGSNAGGDALDGTGGDTLKAEADFSFEVNAPSGNKSSLQLQFSNNGQDQRVRLQLFRFSTLGYGLRVIDQANTVTDSSMVSFADMGMDLDGSDFSSDTLSMSFDITRTETADEWLANAYLYNGETLLTSITDMTVSSSILYGDNTLFSGMDSGSDVNFTSRTVESFTVSQVVPEPATVSLVVIASAGALLWRRVAGL